MALVAPLSGLALASAALAKEPTGDFAIFKQCPRFTSGVTLCLYSETLSGVVTLDKQPIPISNKIVVQGGVAENKVTGSQSLVGPLNGEALVKVPENVPGGVFGNAVTAFTELVRPASQIYINTHHLETKAGVVLALPVRIRLENVLLGSECYIGSSAQPVVLSLTAGTTHPDAPNKPISGSAGAVTFKDEFEFVEIKQDTLVDNEFAAPAAMGCQGKPGFSSDPLVDSKIGLPSPDGYNTAIMNNTVKQAGVPGVLSSEK